MAEEGPSTLSFADLLRRGSRYELLTKIARGGMGTVYAGRLRGAEGFWRLVAIKRAHPHLVEDPAFRRMLVSEARLASRVHHPNVVAVQDVEEISGELLLIMDYVEGAAFSELIWQPESPAPPLPARVAMRIALDACAGLQAAHDLVDEQGEPMHLVHRDVSPHNILVGVEGSARLTDFGIAKVKQGSNRTTQGTIKGKLAYVAPEYVEGAEPDAVSDVFGMGVVVWESLARARLFRASNEVETLLLVLRGEAPRLSSVAPWIGKRLDAVLAKALEKGPKDRFQSARELADALETAARREDLIATATEVGTHVQAIVGASIEERRAMIRAVVAATSSLDTPSPSGAAPRASEVTPEVGYAEGDRSERTTPSGSSEAVSETARSGEALPAAPRRLARNALLALLALGVGGAAALVLVKPADPKAAQSALSAAPLPPAAPSSSAALGAESASIVSPASAAASASSRAASSSAPKRPLGGPLPPRNARPPASEKLPPNPY